jgi:hypothetical protein
MTCENGNLNTIQQNSIMKTMVSISDPSYVLYGFGSYLLVMFVFLGSAVGLHELGHIFFARYHHLEYEILFEKGNLTVSAEWERLGKRKVYGNILGIIFGLPPVIAGGWLYFSPVFLLLYLLSCYDDFSAITKELANCKKVFGAG